MRRRFRIGSAYWLLPIGVALAGIGIGLASASATRIGTDVPPRRRDTAAGMLNTAAQLGSAVGTAALLCLSESTTGDSLPVSGARDYFEDLAITVLHEGGVAAGGWGVPFARDGTSDGLPEGFRTALVASIEDHEATRTTNTFGFMAAAVAKEHDKQGLATVVLEALTERALAAGLRHVVAPIRPTWKHKYPQVPMAEYATWTREDGFSIDPWIRTHQRMGAAIIKPAPDSMVVTGTVAEWEQWAGMPFPASGSYVVPDALNLVEVDREKNRAIYREENLWIQHR